MSNKKIIIMGNRSKDLIVTGIHPTKEHWEQITHIDKPFHEVGGGPDIVRKILEKFEGLNVKHEYTNKEKVHKSISLWEKFDFKDQDENECEHFRLKSNREYFIDDNESKENNPGQNGSSSRLIFFNTTEKKKRLLGEEIKNIKEKINDASVIFFRTHYELNSQFKKIFKAKKTAQKTILIASVSDLRGCSAKIGYPLSWERTFKEIVEAVKKLFGAYQFKSIIIVFSTEGAVIIENNDKTLIFDKTRQEDDWISEKGREGRVFGYASCVLASLVYYEANNNCDKISAIKKGLLAARELHKCGYICKDKSLDFPYESVSKKIKENSSKDNAFSIFKGRGNETILEYALHKKRSNKYELAKQIVEEGIDEALKIKNIYREEIGKWISLDKDEIERVRAIRNIIKVYLKDWPQKKPLSIAVFGPPGSGKSFSIKEILRNSSKDKDNIVIETYNLSQIESPNELTTVFHKIRDIYLNSKIPCFFWDEFDSILNSEQLGWLKHFLAPMQDSNFYQAGFIRPLGAAIFVFAGGTSKTYSEFIESKGLTKKEKQKIKLPDFISRIDGFLDVKGINRNREEYGILGFFTNDDHYIKRAILLRSLLEKKLTKNEDYMDEYVLEKLLKTYEYKFGIRSMEKIIELSHIKDKKRFTISCLPSKSIIKTHIDL